MITNTFTDAEKTFVARMINSFVPGGPAATSANLDFFTASAARSAINKGVKSGKLNDLGQSLARTVLTKLAD